MVQIQGPIRELVGKFDVSILSSCKVNKIILDIGTMNVKLEI